MSEYHDRRFPRYRVKAQLDFSGTEEVMLFHKIENLSLGGVCITSPNPEPEGAEVELEISFPDTDEVLLVRGKVAWNSQEPPVELGIRFIDLDEAKREIMRNYLNRIKEQSE